MIMPIRYLSLGAVLAAGAAVGMPGAAAAQQLPYGDVAASGDAIDAGEGDAVAEEASPRGTGRTRRVAVIPYIEARQVVTAELAPGDEILTYTTLAAGVDANVSGRNNQAGLSLRYERRFGYGENRTADGDVLSGLARASVAVVPQALTLEAGAMAARMSVADNGATLAGVESGRSSQIYGLTIGPSLKARMGDATVEGHYRFGYNRVEAPAGPPPAQGQQPAQLYDEGLVHNAALRAGVAPGTVLPVGLGLGAGWNREDISNLDQRIEDRHLRGDVNLPLSAELALVGGVGYEDVTVAHRDAVRDPVSGAPVIGSDGRYVTDTSQPRRIAYQADGLIWDAGVLWRPGRRTALEAHVGRRYGSTSYHGSFAYAAGARTNLALSVYDNVTGFGGMLDRQLAGLPTNFQGVRNPLSGNLGACVAPVGETAEAGTSGCLGGALGSLSAAAFRGRGVQASLATGGKVLQYGVGLGYDRRKFIAAEDTVLAAANGLVDETLWLGAYLNGRLDRRSSVGTTVWASWNQSGDSPAGDASAVGATAAYYRLLTNRLSATAAIGVEGVNRDLLEDVWSAQATVGVRYSF